MKMKKINLEELGQSMSRSEMKEVMAGSGSDCVGNGEKCSTASDCCMQPSSCTVPNFPPDADEKVCLAIV